MQKSNLKGVLRGRGASMKNSRAGMAGMRIQHPKRRGEWAELQFMARAAEEGLQVTKPWGETAHYDFCVEAGGKFIRVQVKSTIFKDRGGYSCSVRGSCGAYKGGAFDFVAVYVIPEDLWYIIPEKRIRGQGSVAIYPKLKGSKYECYKEAWHFLREAPRNKLERTEACAEAFLCL